MTEEPEQLDLIIAANRQKLIDFFDKGAPHFEFNMDRGLVVTLHHASEVPNLCGSAGCIAGAAFTMWLKTLEPSLRAEIVKKGVKRGDEITTDSEDDPEPQVEYDYHMVRDGALEFLGLSLDEDRGGHFGHPLFSPYLAPQGCTATDAATALRRTFDGLTPWQKR